MAGQLSPKAVREGYAPEAFIFQERTEEGRARFVAWTPDVAQLKGLVYAVLERFPSTVDVLFKVESGAKTARAGWRRYFGTARLDRLMEVIRSVEELVFHDGGSMICVRSSDSGEYIALDEHGTLFIYSSDRGYLNLSEELGFESRVNELIDAQGHWQVRPAHHQKQSRNLIKSLNLKFRR